MGLTGISSPKFVCQLKGLHSKCADVSLSVILQAFQHTKSLVLCVELPIPSFPTLAKLLPWLVVKDIVKISKTTEQMGSSILMHASLCKLLHKLNVDVLPLAAQHHGLHSIQHTVKSVSSAVEKNQR